MTLDGLRIAKMCAGVLLAVVAGGRCAGQATVQPDGEVFPTEKGTHWIYRGEVARQATDEGAKVDKRQVQWDMEVVDSVRRGRYRAAALLGHPADLIWYEEGRERGCYVLLAVDNQTFYLGKCKPAGARASLPDGDLSELIHQNDLIFKLPLHQGEVFGGDRERGERDDTMYAWYVDAVRAATLGGIRGISFDRARMEYVVTYRTNSDHQIIAYALGIGLTSFVYSHHGTVSDVDMKLVEFQRPGPK